jgi:hypothetical protein
MKMELLLLHAYVAPIVDKNGTSRGIQKCTPLIALSGGDVLNLRDDTLADGSVKTAVKDGVSYLRRLDRIAGIADKLPRCLKQHDHDS